MWSSFFTALTYAYMCRSDDDAASAADDDERMGIKIKIKKIPTSLA